MSHKYVSIAGFLSMMAVFFLDPLMYVGTETMPMWYFFLRIPLVFIATFSSISFIGFYLSVKRTRDLMKHYADQYKSKIKEGGLDSGTTSFFTGLADNSEHAVNLLNIDLRD